MQSYKHLPPETWMEICRLVGTQTELARLARVNKYLESIASRPLYKNVTLRSPKALESFSATIAECPDRAASTQVLRLEWVEDERVLTPKSAPRWFMEMMDNLRGGKVEHLALLVSPPVNSKTGVSDFDQAVHTHVKRMRLKGFTLPKSVRTLEAQAQLLHNRIVPVSPGQPLAPLVALSLHAGGGLHLTEWCFPALIPIAKTLRRLRISLEDPEEHPLWFCGCITQPLSLANVEYLEVAHVGPKVRHLIAVPIRSTEGVTGTIGLFAASRRMGVRPRRCQRTLTGAPCFYVDTRLGRRAGPQTRGTTSRVC